MGGDDDWEVPEWEWPTGPAAKAVLALQHELARLIAHRIPVFLDVNFWIFARDAMTGDNRDPERAALLAALLEGVDSGKLLFPVTSDLIVEFSKQPPELLAGTLALVDRLSMKVALVPHHERLAIEVERYLAVAWPDHPPVPRPVWTSFAFAFGYEDLRVAYTKPGGPTPKQMAELAWIAPLSVLGRGISRQAFEAAAEGESAAAWLNEQEALHATYIDGMEAALRAETMGAASLIEGIAARELRRVAAASGNDVAARDVEGSRRFGRSIARVLGDRLRLAESQSQLGSLYVPAMLHAAVRADGHRRMKANDIYDFRHAAAALPYCRLFLTDGPMRTLVTGGGVRLDAVYGCAVVSDRVLAVAALDRLMQACG